MNLENDIAPGAKYMDRKRCFSIYFYTSDDCFDCGKLEECEKQNDRDYPPKKKIVRKTKNEIITDIESMIKTFKRYLDTPKDMNLVSDIQLSCRRLNEKLSKIKR